MASLPGQRSRRQARVAGCVAQLIRGIRRCSRALVRLLPTAAGWADTASLSAGVSVPRVDRLRCHANVVATTAHSPDELLRHLDREVVDVGKRGRRDAAGMRARGSVRWPRYTDAQPGRHHDYSMAKVSLSSRGSRRHFCNWCSCQSSLSARTSRRRRPTSERTRRTETPKRCSTSAYRFRGISRPRIVHSRPRSRSSRNSSLSSVELGNGGRVSLTVHKVADCAGRAP
jgi:hypothetical protein